MAGAGWGCWDQGSHPNLFPARMLSLYVPLEISFPRGLHLEDLKHHHSWKDHLQECKPRPQQWKCQILTTRPPKKSLLSSNVLSPWEERESMGRLLVAP